jgi:hypothetical protein
VQELVFYFGIRINELLRSPNVIANDTQGSVSQIMALTLQVVSLLATILLCIVLSFPVLTERALL